MSGPADIKGDIGRHAAAMRCIQKEGGPMPRRGRDTSADTFSAVPHEPWIMGLEMRPNRYGGAGDRMLGETNGDLCCRHNVPLWKICKRCNQLLSWVRDPELYRIDNPFSGDPETNGWTPELPTLIGTGDE